MLKDALPEALRILVPIACVPSLKVTVPVGTCDAPTGGFTVATKVIVWWKVEGLLLLARLVPVGAWLMATKNGDATTGV